MLSIGYTMAPMIPMTVTITAAYFPRMPEKIVSPDTPAAIASRNVVVYRGENDDNESGDAKTGFYHDEGNIGFPVMMAAPMR